MDSSSSSSKRTEIAALGEFGLIDRLTHGIELKNQSSLFGAGDDAAVISAGDDKVKVVTTDLLLEGIHFDLMYHPLQHLGFKAIAVNVSDIYAMNAVPEQVIVGLGLSNRFSVEAIEEIYAGMLAACEKYGVDLVGGDTNSSHKGLILSITAIGSAKKEDVVYRHGAKPGDVIMVSGDLGAAYLGLQILEREKKLFLENPEIQPDLENESYLVGRQLLPKARKDIHELLEELSIRPTSMIDISDGLSSDLLHICHRSGVGCRLREEAIPIAEEARNRALQFNLVPSVCALNGGEDYELLFTVSVKDAERLATFPDVTAIGDITLAKEGRVLVTRSGQVHDLTAQGWQHL